MCDFLVSSGSRYRGRSLLEFVKAPYGKSPPEGRFFDFSWGSVAILEERLARNNNIYTQNGTVFAWIGDLVMDVTTETTERLIKHIKDIANLEANSRTSLEHDELFKKLNGAFAILIAHENGFSIITDPMNFTPVYAGTDTNNKTISFGTHPDLVACISSDTIIVDEISAAEYLTNGNSTFPNTIHRNVKELGPGRLHSILFENGSIVKKEFVYWSLPEEIRKDYNEDILAGELKDALVSAVKDRCGNKKIGVLLSGGLDSRMIMAAVPDNTECIGITFSEYLNRESRTAEKVAKCYNRDWQLLIRDSEFLANSIEGIARLVGCECEWVSAHGYGFANKIVEYDVDSLLSGQMFDSFLKAYFAFDYVKKKPRSLLLPANYEKRNFLYENNIRFYIGNDPGFWNQFLAKNVLTGISNRRKQFYDVNLDENRGSVELFFLYPFSQFIDGASWTSDRRTLPEQLVGFDRRLLDFAFQCPIELKLGNKIYLKAAMEIYGPGARIRNANDGVRPGSSHLSRLAQRATRKFQDRTAVILEYIGKKRKVQHSWSNYEKYWKESKKLKSLIEEYGENLDQFNGRLFKKCGKDLLKSEDINWRNGFRLLHLAVWAGIMKDYQKRLGKKIN